MLDQLRLGLRGVSTRPPRTPAQIEADSAQRAKRDARRMIRANGCRYLWTFTNVDELPDWVEFEQRKRGFLKRCAEYAAGRLPVPEAVWTKVVGQAVAAAASGRSATTGAYRLRDLQTRVHPTFARGVPVLILIPEPHPEGHGWHMHAATNVFIPHPLLDWLWGHGIVNVKYARPRGARWGPRRLARYLAKYLSKDVAEGDLHGCSPRPAGAHRWWHIHGIKPTIVRKRFERLEDALVWLRSSYGQWDDFRVFGLDDDWPVKGVWLDFPDGCVAAYRKRVNGQAQPAGGQP